MSGGYAARIVNPMPTTSPVDRALAASQLRRLALLSGIAAGLWCWIGGRALNAFGEFDPMLGEMIGIALAALLGVIAALLRGLAQRIENDNLQH